jgi:hypothetical protein
MTVQLVVRRNGDGTVTASPAHGCPLCRQPSMVENIPEEAFDSWWRDGKVDGQFIQQALPMLSAGDREVLISGTHDECWDKMFPPDDEDPETELRRIVGPL